MSGLFDYLKRLTDKKAIEESEEQFQKDFSPFMVNRFMSCDKQLVMLAAAMNQSVYTKRQVFDFYDGAIPKTKKFIKYSAKKSKADKQIQYIMEWFGCNIVNAKQYHTLLDDEELTRIVDHFEKERKGRQ